MFDLDLLPPNEDNYRRNDSPDFDSGISKGSVSPHSSLCGEFGSSDGDSVVFMPYFGEESSEFIPQDVFIKSEPDPDKVSLLLRHFFCHINAIFTIIGLFDLSDTQLPGCNEPA